MKCKFSSHWKSLIPDFIVWSKLHKETTLFKTKETLLTTGSVQSLSCVRLFGTSRAAARQASLSITEARSSLKLMSIKLVIPSSLLNFCCPLLLWPFIPPSIRVFSNESTLCMRWPKYWSISFSISPSNEHPRLISFRRDWLDYCCLKDHQILHFPIPHLTQGQEMQKYSFTT